MNRSLYSLREKPLPIVRGILCMAKEAEDESSPLDTCIRNAAKHLQGIFDVPDHMMFIEHDPEDYHCGTGADRCFAQEDPSDILVLTKSPLQRDLDTSVLDFCEELWVKNMLPIAIVTDMSHTRFFDPERAHHTGGWREILAEYLSHGLGSVLVKRSNFSDVQMANAILCALKRRGLAMAYANTMPANRVFPDVKVQSEWELVRAFF